jgi:hypothetical protein
MLAITPTAQNRTGSQKQEKNLASKDQVPFSQAD